MRGIERVVAGILLVAAVCGSAAFARGVGREAAFGTEDVQLTAAPPQHAQSSKAVQVPLYPLLVDRPTPARTAAKTAAKPSLADTPVLVSTPVQRVVAAPAPRHVAPPPRAYTPAPVAKPAAPKPSPAPARTPAPPPSAPAQKTESRILAKVPLTPTPTWQHVKGIGPGRIKNHPDDSTAAPATQQQQPTPTPQSSSTITLVVLAPAPPSPESQGDVPGKGHAYGHLKQGLNNHD